MFLRPSNEAASAGDNRSMRMNATSRFKKIRKYGVPGMAYEAAKLGLVWDFESRLEAMTKHREPRLHST